MDAERRNAELEAKLAEREREIAELRAEVLDLKAQVAKLLELLNRNSGNSGLPPSSDSPAARSERNARRHGGKGTKRRRGGQPKHRGTRRELLPAERVDDVVQFFPSHCEGCSAALAPTPDPHPKRYQTTELPAIEPHTTEYQRHSVTCARCRHATLAPFDASRIPASPFGPRLMSVTALLTGVYHLSRRKAAQLLSDIVGVKLSLGAVSNVEARVSSALEAPVHEAWQRVAKAPVKHTDGTSWLQCGVTLSLWVIASAVATVYKIVANGRRETIAPLFGEPKGIMVSDRATALNFWSMENRQICWAHLLRKFVSFSERDGPAGRFGRDLLDYTGIMFDYWHDHRAGHLSRDQLQARLVPVRSQLETLLERAATSKLDSLSGSCANILEHRAALWTFVDTLGVEPTNNHAERELRAFVMWRKKSYGTQSERGNQFAERLMTVAHTARKQKKGVLELITECCVAKLDGTAPPSLFA